MVNKHRADAIFTRSVAYQKMTTISLTLILLSLAYSTAKAETFIVAPDGSTAYSTIQKAVRKAKDGDIIEVRPGQYSGSVVIRKDIELLGAGYASTILQDGDRCLRVSKVAKGKVSGFTFQVNAYGRNGGVTLSGCGEDFVFTDNVVRTKELTPDDMSSSSSPPNPAIVVDGGTPLLETNLVFGGIRVTGKAHPRVFPNQNEFKEYPDFPDEFSTMVLLSGSIAGTKSFSSKYIRNVHVENSLYKFLEKNIRRAFPFTLTMDSGAVKYSGAWILSVNVTELKGAYSNGGVDAKATVRLDLKDIQDKVLCTAVASAQARDSSPVISETSSGNYVSYRGLLQAILNSDPFERSSALAAFDSLKEIKLKARAAIVAETEEILWATAMQKHRVGDPAQLQEYLTNYPDGKYHDQANKLLLDLKITQAINDSEIQLLNETLAEHPSHERVTEIRAFLTRTKMAEAKRIFAKQTASGTTEAFKAFAKNYPGSPFAAEAKKRAASIQFNKDEAKYAPYKLKDTIAGYQAFIKQHPANQFVNKAQKRIEQLSAWFVITSSGSFDQAVDIKKRPQALSETITRVKVGAKFPIISQDENWVSVALRRNQSGYILKKLGKTVQAKDL